jgi:hypothetical protein
MNNKKFIGGGFPGIKPCIDEKTMMTKESREKREFSVRKLVSVSQLLTKSRQIKGNDSELLSVQDNITYDTISNITHNSITGHLADTDIDLNLINAPIKRRKLSRKRTSKRKDKMNK